MTGTAPRCVVIVIPCLIRPGGIYRRFAASEPTMGIALVWRRGDTLPTLLRLREIDEAVARARRIEHAT